MEHPCKREGGFTLIELMIVVGLLGLVMGAIFSLYSVHMKTAYSQSEVVDVQRNLRVALDTMARDLRMAGVLVPAGPGQTLASPAGSPAFPSYSTNVSIKTASAEARFARVAAPLTVAAGSTTLPLTVESPATATSPNVVDGFAANDNVRIIRPVDGSQPLSGTRSLVVVNVAGNPNRGVFGATSPSITLGTSDGSAFTAGDNILPGDMIAKVADASTYPMTVDYYLVVGGTAVNGYSCPQNQQCLVRRVNGTADIVATGLSSLRFGYLNDSYLEESVPLDPTKIRAVRITLQGATSKTAAMSGAKSRALTSIVKLRNRR